MQITNKIKLNYFDVKTDIKYLCRGLVGCDAV